MTVEAKSPHAGVIKEMFVKEGETVEVGGNFFSVEIGADRPAESAPTPPPSPTPSTEAPPPPKSEAKAPPQPPKKPEAKPVPPASTPLKGGEGGPTRGERREKMSRMRQTIARTLKNAQNELAQLTTFNEVDMTELSAKPHPSLSPSRQGPPSILPSRPPLTLSARVIVYSSPHRSPITLSA